MLAALANGLGPIHLPQQRKAIPDPTVMVTGRQKTARSIIAIATAEEVMRLMLGGPATEIRLVANAPLVVVLVIEVAAAAASEFVRPILI